MPNQALCIEGRVALHDGAHASPGLLLELWPVDEPRDEPIAAAYSEADGRFRIHVPAKDLALGEQVGGGTGRRRLEVRVVEGGRVVQRSAYPDPRVAEFVEIVLPHGQGDAEVYGQVHGVAHVDGARVSGALRTIGKGGATEEPLGDAQWGEDGQYRLGYLRPADPTQLARTAVVVRLHDTDGVVLAESEPQLAPPPRLRVDLRVPRAALRRSEYELVVERLRLDVAAGPELVDGLAAEAIEELASWLEIESYRLGTLQCARALQAQTGLPTELFYAFGRSGLPLALEDLAELPAHELRGALDEAITDRIIDARAVPGRDELLARLGHQLVEAALAPGRGGARPNLAETLTAADLDERVVRDVLGRYRARTGSAVEFWESLYEGGDDHEDLAEDIAPELELAVELGALVGGDPDLLRALHELRRAGRWQSLDDLADFSLDTWSEIVDGARPWIEDAEANDDAAEAIFDALEVTFPSRAIRRELIETEEVGEAARQILHRAADHDLVAGSIRARVERDAAVVEGLSPEAREAAIEELEAVERVARVTPRAHHVTMLVATGMTSAHAIAVTPLRHFAEMYGEAFGGRAEAATIHAQAQQQASANTLAMVGLLQALQQSPMVVGGGVQALQAARDQVLKEMPDARVLFGSVGACGCEHCSSVYSPAAYFVDLMRYLDVADPKRLEEVRRKLARRRGVDAGRIESLAKSRPLETLLGRRPDLADIPLTCENTFTTLPYIDLVNEVLEARVVGGNAAHDTGKTPADVLRAVPQNIHRPAYDQLQAAVFPTSLPYHEPLAVLRAYLGHLGVPREELLRLFAKGDTRDEVLLAEALQMSLEELGLVVRAPDDPWRHFGFAAAEEAGVAWITRLSRVPVMCSATGLGFAQLIDLVSMRFVNADDAIKLETPIPDCDPEKITIVGLDPARLVRMMRCIRLQRRLGWSFTELDGALAAFGATDLDAPTLRKLVDARTLARRIDRSLWEVLSLWAPIETRRDESLFTRLLQTRAVAWRANDKAALTLRPDRTELAATADTLDGVTAALLAAFRITSDDLAVILAILGRKGVAPRLDVAGISAVHRVAFLARALRLRLDQLDGLLRLAPPDADPFTTGDPAATIRFVDLVDEIAGSELTPERLNYLFAPIVARRRDPAPSAEQVSAVLERVRRALTDAFNDTAPPAEVTLEAVRGKLALLFDGSTVQATLDVIDPRTKVALEQRRAFFDRHLARLFPDAAAAAALLFEAPPPSLPAAPTASPTTEATPAAAPPAAPSPLELRWRSNLGLLLLHLLPVLRAKQMRGAVVQVLADALGLSTASTATLLDGVIRSRLSSGQPVIQDFFALLGRGLSGAYYANAELTGTPALVRTDARLDFAWAGTSPGAGLEPTGFSVRWTGRLLPRVKAPHTFLVTSEGAVRVSIKIGDAERVVLEHAGGGQPVERSSTPVELDPAQLYEITIEYRNRGGAATFVLQHATGPSGKAPLATAQLFPADGPTSFAPTALAYRRLHKAAMLVSGLGLDEAQLAWLVGPPRLLDLDGLPMTPEEAGPASRAAFGRWRQLAALVALRKRLPRSDRDLLEVLRTPAAQAIDVLVAATGWDRSVTAALLGPQGFAADAEALSLPTDPSQPPMLLRLARAMDAHRRIGLAPELLFTWANAAPDADVAAAVVQVVKARYDEKRWLEVAQALNDPLRIERRDALVAYLLPRMGLSGRNQLFEYFLIDVDMNPCMSTSRIKQAISAVQTFFQRCLMNLESQVPPRLIDESDWKRLKNYRVWEANRKIFLYPENWIEPELRDDKSPIFKELERTILQQEIKKENVESAFIDYLQRLDEVARLDVRAVWYERRQPKLELGQRDPAGAPPPPPASAPAGRWDGSTYRSHWDDGTYHVFARSFDAPYVWFYRRLDRGRTWSPWEKIDADIEGDNLVPVVFQRRLYLFWTIFREVTKPPLDPSKDAAPYKLGKDWEASIAYSVYDRGRWTRKRLSSSSVTDDLKILFPTAYAIDAVKQNVGKLEKKPPPPRIEGSAWLPLHAYSLRATVSDERDELVVHLYRRLVDLVRIQALPEIPKSGEAFLSNTDVALVASYRIDGCNGELDAHRAGNSAFIMMRRVGQSTQRAVRGRVGASRRKAVQRVDGALVPIAPPSFAFASGGHIDAPAGFRVDGNGLVSMRRGASTLALPPGPGRGPIPVLGSVSGESIRIVPVSDGAEATPVGLFPFFFQDRRRSYFVRPVAAWIGAQIIRAPLVARPLVGIRAFAHFGRPLAIPAKSARPAGRPARRRGESVEAEPESQVASVRGLDDDRREDRDEAAWHPDDVSERRGAPRPGRRPPPPPPRPPVAVSRPAVVVAPPAPAPVDIHRPAQYEWRLHFSPFEHPATCRLIRRLMIGGIEELLDLEATRPTDGRDHRFVGGRWVPNPVTTFARRYRPGPLTDARHPRLDVDFDPDNPYAAYNWELFFHAPLQVATRLAKDGRHEEAQRWFHFIFDPTSDSSSPAPSRYWNFAPFHENSEYDGARELMALLSYKGTEQKLIRRQHHVLEQVTAWWENPFSPHVIARMRIAAYQKAVVMKYVDNLIEWGDKLFRRDTMESIQEATQLYILAGNILGPRPERVPPMVRVEPVTFRKIRGGLDVFGNWVVNFENTQVRRPFRVNAAPDVAGAVSVLGMATQYFCIPTNPQLDKYWDTVADRLFKIRNCMNIKGTVRSLALFEPPIDPGMLVRAAAAGADLGSVVAELNAPPPHHRFRVLAARAVALTEEVRRFGKATLEALEKRDAESLAVLRTHHESALLEAVRDIGKTRIKQVEEELVWLAIERDHIDLQIQHVATLAATLMNPQENAKQAALTAKQVLSGVAEGVDLVSKVLYAIPDFQAGAAGGFSSPFTTVQLGGQMFGAISTAFAESLTKIMSKSETEADMAEAQAEYQRRQEELVHQHELLLKEKEKLTKQIGEINLKLEIHAAELRRADLAVENSRQIETTLREKFTSEQLYGWMLGQLSGIYFQAYKTAFDCAKLAERALRFERGDQALQYVEFSYWDSLKKGLHAGDRLLVDLRRMETAYLEGDGRSFEITRHLSLREDAPAALLELLATGRCRLEVTESLLDGDFPGHYFRRLKTASLTVTGPTRAHANVNCTLTLLANRVRVAGTAGGAYPAAEDGEDARFAVNLAPIQAIATSRPQADAGLFELRFDDDRYLPFEGAGAISSWRLELKQADNAVDLSQVRDVVLTLAYTARSGGAALELAARTHREKLLARGGLEPPAQEMISLRRDFPDAWKQLVDAAPGKDVELDLPLDAARFSGRYRGLTLRIERVVAQLQPIGRPTDDPLRMRIDPPSGSGTTLAGWLPAWPGATTLRASAEVAGAPGKWKLAVGTSRGRVPEAWDDIVLLFDLRARVS